MTLEQILFQMWADVDHGVRRTQALSALASAMVR
jgi:hypothetical protein